MALTTAMVSLACGAVLVQEIGLAESAQPIAPYEEVDATDAPDVVFSNLDISRDDLYNTNSVAAFFVAGKSASTHTEQWQAIRFIPKVDVQAKVLAAAIGYTSGTMLVKLGIYSNDEISNSVGTLLPGGEGSTSEIPDVGECCKLAKVTLAGEGVLLTAGTQYWLVASPDNVKAPTFQGRWHLSNLAISAGMAPPLPWGNFPGGWPAAEIRGTNLQAPEAGRAATSLELPSSPIRAPAAKITIFTNLGPTFANRYNYFVGSAIAGSDVPAGELWQALPFTPGADVRVKTLTAAIGYLLGTRLVNLGIYNDNAGTVGTPLPGGQGSTTEIPDSGDCCELAKVKLPGAGVALIAGVQYWLVASPDNVNAPDFAGQWQHSNLALRAYKEPENFVSWNNVSGVWLAAEIRGTNP